MTRHARALTGVAALLAVSLTGWWLAARRADPPTLVLYSTLSKTLVALNLNGPEPKARELPCMALGSWAQHVGEVDGRLIALDADQRRLAWIELPVLRDVVAGQLPCERETPRTSSARLASNAVPYTAVVSGRKLYVSYFADNSVEEYGLSLDAEQPLVHERRLPFESDTNLGISDIAVDAGRLLVAASGFECFARNCPRGRFGPSRLFVVDLGHAASPASQLRPENVNGAGLYAHAPNERYLISAGDFHGGHSSLQRIGARQTLSAAIRLPINSAARKAHRLSDRYFLLTQFSGPHLLVFDTERAELSAAYRLDRTRLERLDPVPAELPGRATSDVQDVVPDPQDATRFFLIDSRGDRLVHVSVDEDGRLTQLRSIRFDAGPTPIAASWGFVLAPR